MNFGVGGAGCRWKPRPALFKQVASEQTGDELQHGGFSPKNFRESDALLLGGYSVFVPHRQVRHGSGA
jgi:hypothetical protein